MGTNLTRHLRRRTAVMRNQRRKNQDLDVVERERLVRLATPCLLRALPQRKMMGTNLTRHFRGRRTAVMRNQRRKVPVECFGPNQFIALDSIMMREEETMMIAIAMTTMITKTMTTMVIYLQTTTMRAVFPSMCSSSARGVVSTAIKMISPCSSKPISTTSIDSACFTTALVIKLSTKALPP